jgi:hypothetical protein
MRTSSVNKVLKPEVAIPAAYVLFLAMAFLSYRVEVTARYLFASPIFEAAPSPIPYLTTALGIGGVIVCVRGGRRIEIDTNRKGLRALALTALFIVTALTVYLTLGLHPGLCTAASGGYLVILFFISKRLGDIKTVVVSAGLLTVTSSILVTVLAGDVPILDPAARQVAAMSPFRALFHGFGVFAATLSVVFYGRRYLAVGGVLAVLGIISGFKSDAIALLLSASIGGLISGRVRLKEVGAVLVIIGGILTIMSTYIAVLSFGSWKIPPAYYPLYRAGFTFLVFDKVVALSMPWGLLNGGAILSTSQEVVSTAVLDYATPHIITSTLFGPLTLDFGIIGTLATSAFIGLYFGVLGRYRDGFQAALYAIVLTHTLILIEVGLQMTSLILYISVLYLFLSWKGEG